MAEPRLDPVSRERRDSLIDATMTAIAEHGFSNLTLAKIAARAGLTAGSVNFHFASKQALLLATLKQVAEEFETRIDVALDTAGNDPAARLKALLHASLDPVLTEPRKVAVWYAFMAEASAREDYLRICGARDARFRATIVALCEALIETGGQQRAQHAPALGAALSGLIDELWQEVLFDPRAADRAAAARQIDAFLASVFPWCFEMPDDVLEPARVTGDGPGGLVHTLPAWTYRSEPFHRLELEHLFLPAWQLVCHVSDLPDTGAYARFELGRERAFVVRDDDGVVRAFHNVCRHRAHSLVAAELGACPGRLTCPYHGWTYALDGKRIALGAPDSFRRHDPADFGLLPVDCEVYQGFVFIRFRDDGGPSVAETLAPVADEFAAYRTAEMRWCANDWENDFWVEDVAVDWKNGTENYLEDYHFATGHKGLAALMDPRYEREPHPGLARLSHVMRTAPRPSWSAERYHAVLPEYEHLPESMRRRWTYYAMYPNTFFDFFPEQMDFMQMLPLGPGRMRLRGRSYALVGDGENERETRAARYLSMRINMRVQHEDNRLTREVQGGLATSAYEYGILSDKEILVRHFQDWVRERLPIATLATDPSEERLHGLT